MAKSSDLSSSNWECLPDDLISSIIEKLVRLSDFIQFSIVCKSWNSMASNHRIQKLNQLSNHQLPWQFMCNRDEKVASLCNYLPNTSPKIFNFQLRIPSRYITMMRHCYGSSHGWLVFRDDMEYRYTTELVFLVLLNPLSGAIFRLPLLATRLPNRPRSILYADGFGSVVLSRDPSLGSFEVLIFGAYVAHLKFGDKFWTLSERLKDFYSPQSLIFYKDRIIGACNYGGIMCLDFTTGVNGSRRIELRKIIPKQDVFIGDCFLSETTFGDLLVVYRYINGEKCGKYKVSKLIESDGQLPRLVPVNNLDGHSIFLSEQNHSISVLASNYAGYCRPNSIYYQYRNRQMSCMMKPRTPNGFCDVEMEEFYLEDQSCQKHRIPVSLELFWIVPSMTLPPA
ncbi:hypothetical protein FNV43_RR00663 [Rhamnella rubrinervis]|uniref:F-box domain-containing protein n=1 Tax=Rhamnella rubrinervis TaxID=2594499 RepID=A0A8K0MSM2_9ROSA|nr:hypothetical protein FNV43_RR00663 [Rhamnella rubrinervis]